MAFSTLTHKESSVIALAMNIVVSALAFLAFHRAKHFDWQISWPFLIGSVPAAYLGGKLKLPPGVHEPILAAVLFAAALLLFFRPVLTSETVRKPAAIPFFLIGVLLGLVSGIVGIGGGVFLSPLIILMGWADAKRTASLAALFILANSCAGLIARGSSTVQVIQLLWYLPLVGAFGAVLGSYLGAFKVDNMGLRRILGVLLVIASVLTVL